MLASPSLALRRPYQVVNLWLKSIWRVPSSLAFFRQGLRSYLKSICCVMELGIGGTRLFRASNHVWSSLWLGRILLPDWRRSLCQRLRFNIWLWSIWHLSRLQSRWQRSPPSLEIEHCFFPQYAVTKEMRMTRYHDIFRTKIHEFARISSCDTLLDLVEATKNRELQLETQ